ncbi:hypothetical protein ACFQ08_14385 [Streptosporangium algeriense]|uniref:DNA-binding protein n=1 Tax=Streptosporangium algeriense TaxID=1682748 RepID=A0ABW3DRL3_9ACTN
MNHPTIPGSWLTISDILTDLDVPEHEWREWQAVGQTPLSVVSADGTEWVRLAHYERWLDSLTDDGTEGDER